MGGSSFDWFLQLFAVSSSVGSQCFDYFDNLKLVFFSTCKFVILLIAQVKGCKRIKLASGKGIQENVQLKFLLRWGGKTGGAGWVQVCPIYVLGRRGKGQSQHSAAQGSGTQVCLRKVFL